jgi:glycosyltransferase involved in cell wall biosynthesis
MSKPNISAVLLAHREGEVTAGLSLRSFLDCIARAEKAGISIERIVVLDRADEETRLVFANQASHDGIVLETDFGDQGLARNEGVRCASGQTIAFLDADDLWGVNWLSDAWSMLSKCGSKTIVHPEFNWFFHSDRSLVVNTDQTDPDFDVEFLRFGNYWDALCLASRQAYLDFPFCKRDIEGGFAYEDWHWNCETLAAGYVHRVARGTIHFKRRQRWSQTIEASTNRSLIRRTPLLSYAWTAQPK